MVQRELARRTKGKNRHSGVHLLSGRIKCGDCGGWYGSKVWHSPEKCKRTVWQYNQKYKNEVRCTTPYLDEASVKDRFTVAVNQLLAGRDAAIAAYEQGMALTLDTTELEAQQQELLGEMEVLNGMLQQMIRQNATVAQDQTEYNQRFDSISEKFKEAEAKKDAVTQQISDIRDRRGTMEDFLRILKQQDGEVTAFSEKLWCGLLDYTTLRLNQRKLWSRFFILTRKAPAGLLAASQGGLTQSEWKGCPQNRWIKLRGVLRHDLRGWPPDLHIQKRLHLRVLSRVNATLPIIGLWPVTGSLFMLLELCFFLYRHPDCTMIIRVRHFSVYTVIPLYRGVSAQLVIRISG